MKQHNMVAALCAGLAIAAFAGPAGAEDNTLRVGVLASLSGPFAQLGEDGRDGVELAFQEVSNQVAGRPVKLFIEDSAADPAKAVEKTRALINRDHVQLILGPLSGAEGLAVKEAADEWPDVTIIVAGAAAEDVTMRGVKPNVFRTSYTGAQPTFPLGEYAFDKGYKKIAVVAEDYAFPYAQVGGFLKTYCARGGHVPQKFWVPIGTNDYSSIFPQINKDVDALFVALGGTDAVNFIRQMDEFGKLGKIPVLGGTVTVDATQLSSVGDLLDGVVSGSIMSGKIDSAAFRKFDAEFEALRHRPPSLFVENYYRAAKWAILTLQAMDGKLEDQNKFRQTLLATSFEAPASFVSFDAFHNVVTDVYLNQVQKVGNEWRNVPIKTYPKVSQFWTFDPKDYQASPAYDRDHPDCP
jgi:branched-chain amino acid transport system substrate-binding protein